MFRPLHRLRAALLVAALLCGAPLAAQAPAVPAAEPGSELRVYVMTMGPGSLVWERFGHNAIWIHDELRGTDKAYNYGLFDFQQENFLLRFVQGRMLYWMEGFDAWATARHYAQDNRSVWTQELNLTPAQRVALRDFLEWNERPENRFYRYDYYRDNCSTRVRDAIDRVLGGEIRRQTEGVETGTTYRSHTRRLTTGDVPIYTGLMLGLGQPVDRPISAWEEMFLPMQLRENLRLVKLRAPDGSEMPLVHEEEVLHLASRPPMPEAPPNRVLGYLLAGVALGGALLLLERAAARGVRGSRFGLAALGTLWALSAGLGGLVLAGLWALTDHAAAYRNENLLQLNPLALGLVVLVPALVYGRRWAAGPARALALLTAALSLLGFALQALPGLDQVNGEPMALALPLNLALAWIVVRIGNRARRTGDRAARTALAEPAAGTAAR